MSRPATICLLLCCAVLAATGLGGCGSEQQDRTTRYGKVLRVVDGDTILVRSDGARERVRYIGVDTPESVAPGEPVQCYAELAARFNGELVSGQDIEMRFDVEKRDRFGRLLAYVFRRSDRLFVNAELIRAGYARALAIPPNTSQARRFRELQAEAKAGERGLWLACRR